MWCKKIHLFLVYNKIPFFPPIWDRLWSMGAFYRWLYGSRCCRCAMDALPPSPPIVEGVIQLFNDHSGGSITNILEQERTLTDCSVGKETLEYILYQITVGIVSHRTQAAPPPSPCYHEYLCIFVMSPCYLLIFMFLALSPLYLLTNLDISTRQHTSSTTRHYHQTLQQDFLLPVTYLNLV